jgi:hypothetical protein
MLALLYEANDALALWLLAELVLKPDRATEPRNTCHVRLLWSEGRLQLPITVNID